VEVTVRDGGDAAPAKPAAGASDDPYRQLFDRQPHPSWVFAADDLRFLAVNDAALERYGYTREEFLGLQVTDIRPPSEVPRLLDRLKDFREAKAGADAPPTLQGQWRHRRKDGTLLDVEVRAQEVVFDGRAAFLVVAQDITEQKRSAEALRQSEERYRLLVELSPDAIVIHSQGMVVFANTVAVRLLGASSPLEIIGRSTLDFVHPDSRPGVIARMRRLARGEPVPFVEEKFLRIDGSVIDVEAGAVPFTFHDAPAVQVVIRDISDRKRAETLQSALYRIADLTTSVEDMPAFYRTIHGVVGELMYAENFYLALRDEETGDLRFEYFVDEVDDAPPPIKPGKTLTEYVLRTGEPLLVNPTVHAELERKGEIELVGAASLDWLGVPLKRGDETFGVIVVQSYEETVRYSATDREILTFVSQHVATALDRKRAADALRASEARFRTLAETAPCAILIYQGDSFRYVNPAAASITGWDRSALTGRAFWDLVHPDFHHLLRGSRGAGRGIEAAARQEFRIVRRDGEERWLDFSAGQVEFGGRPATLGIAFDVTERKRAEEQIKELAYHDALTGLPNRLLFNDRLAVAVAQAHRSSSRLAVLFLDLDRFKVINDSLGHSLGDRLLQEVGRRLQAGIREGDTVARLGGDEFILLLPGIGRAEDAAKVAEKILDMTKFPVRLEDRELFVTASIGISLYPDDGLDVDSLIKNADTAMYRAKEQGRDNYQLYTHAMNETAVERLALESSLRKALPGGQLVLHYQPLLDLGTGRVHGVEALLRWNHPERGLVAPSEFLSLAEITSLIVPMGPWTLRTACAQARAWQEEGHPALTVAVNLSARQFQQPDLVLQVRRALDETGLPPSSLDLEVTETHAMQNAEATIMTLRELKRIGVRISIDDFGIGYSSLSYLKRLPIDTLKIDQSFVRDITTDPDDAAIATAVIALAHTLKLRVVAEGVETQEQLEFLSARHCDRMQGYLFSRPLTAEECGAFLARARKPA
jgi:diguanylate cyclase (GGDEF)-like protein/PAS domain S-box-containing protein